MIAAARRACWRKMRARRLLRAVTAMRYTRMRRGACALCAYDAMLRWRRARAASERLARLRRAAMRAAMLLDMPSATLIHDAMPPAHLRRLLRFDYRRRLMPLFAAASSR